MCERRVKDVPIITMIIDELQGEAGMKTRLESFVDILRMKKTGAVAGRG
jgi:predicted nucleotide-binding protein (sugar kinase/HSP70/actin superfamily)